MSDLVGNPEDRFSHKEAQIMYFPVNPSNTMKVGCEWGHMVTWACLHYVIIFWIMSILSVSVDK